MDETINPDPTLIPYGSPPEADWDGGTQFPLLFILTTGLRADAGQHHRAGVTVVLHQVIA